MPLCAPVPNWIQEILDDLKTHEIWDETVRIGSCSLEFVPDHFKMQQMRKEAVRIGPLKFVLDYFLTQEILTEQRVSAPTYFLQWMCNEGVTVVPSDLKNIPDNFKTQETCNDALFGESYLLQNVHDGFVTKEVVDDDDYCNNDEHFECYISYKQRLYARHGRTRYTKSCHLKQGTLIDTKIGLFQKMRKKMAKEKFIKRKCTKHSCRLLSIR